MTDIIVALKQILLSDVSITAFVNDRIYNEELGADENQYMPRKVIVVKNAGGLEINNMSPIITPRFDVWCYGESFYEARKLVRAVYDCIKSIERKSIVDTLIHSIGLSSGFIQIREPDTKWIAYVISVTVRADKRDIV